MLVMQCERCEVSDGNTVFSLEKPLRRDWYGILITLWIEKIIGYIVTELLTNKTFKICIKS